MKEQVDADTWIGTASGYQRTLYYHVRRLENTRFCGIEWQCGYEYRKYFKCYPVLLFPARLYRARQRGNRRLFPLDQCHRSSPADADDHAGNSDSPQFGSALPQGGAGTAGRV